MLLKIDFAILHFILDYCHTTLGDWLMVFVSRLGNAGVIWIMVCLALMFSKKYRKYVPFILVALGIETLLGERVIKPLVGRIRPCYLEEVKMLIKKPHGYSFPSNHSMSSFLMATYLGKLNHKMGYPAFVLAGLIAFSRVYLYVHFPSDVLAGSLFGVLLGVFFYQVTQYMLNDKLRG